jgi:hypothetical protein
MSQPARPASRNSPASCVSSETTSAHHAYVLADLRARPTTPLGSLPRARVAGPAALTREARRDGTLRSVADDPYDDPYDDLRRGLLQLQSDLSTLVQLSSESRRFKGSPLGSSTRSSLTRSRCSVVSRSSKQRAIWSHPMDISKIGPSGQPIFWWSSVRCSLSCRSLHRRKCSFERRRSARPAPTALVVRPPQSRRTGIPAPASRGRWSGVLSDPARSARGWGQVVGGRCDGSSSTLIDPVVARFATASTASCQ